MPNTNPPDTEQEDQQPSGVSRRSLFHILGSTPALAALAAGTVSAQTHDHSHASATAIASGPYKRKVFDDAQWRTVRILSDLIIPADERSGSATQAGVPEFIDDWLDFRNREDGNENFSAQVLGGLTWLDMESQRLNQKSFADVSQDQQKKLLDRIAWPARAAKEDAPWVAFFTRFRDLVVSGFFSSKMGVADLPYLGNRAVTEWKGCDPKVWAIIEERMKNGYQSLQGPVKPWPA